jgi:hypothetical protein
MPKALLALLALLLLSCTRHVPNVSCYSCTQWAQVTKPGCPPSVDSLSWTECHRTPGYIDSLVSRGTFVEYGVGGYRGESITKCKLKP